MEMEVALKMGFLFVPPNNFLRKTWLKRYCALYSASNHGIQRMELFETEDAYAKQNPSKLIPLTDCWKVTPLPQKNQPNVFEVRTKNNSYQFSADTFQDMSDWLVSLQTVAFNKTHSKPFSTMISSNEEKQEENLLYCSMMEPEVYSVKAVATEAVMRNNLKGDYMLIITSVNFSIAEESSLGRIGRVILTWPYRHIRRYGCSTENFSFEAGRKCYSGEGLFTFATNDGLKIFQSVDGHVSALKSSQGETDIPNSPSIKDDKNNFFTSKDSLNSNDPQSYQISNNQPFSLSSTDKEAALAYKSSLKSLPPFEKPPRKSKSNAYDQYFDKESTVNNTTIQDSTNQYAEICGSSNNLALSAEISHITTSSIKEAVLTSKLPHQVFPLNSDNKLNISQVSEQPESSFNMETLRISDVSRNNSKVKRASSPLNYENCSPAFEKRIHSSRSTFSAERIYGKILNTRQSAPSNSSNTYGSIITKSNTNSNTSPMYSNLPFSKQSSGDSARIENDPKHFMKNEAEYAQVLKKNKNVP